MNIRSNQIAGLLSVVTAFFLMPGVALAQNTGGGQNTGGQNTGNTGQPPTAVPTAPTNTAIPSPQQSAELGGQGDIIDLGSFIEGFNIAPETEPIESQRLQPFVGASIENFTEQNLAHPRSQIAPGSGGQSGAGNRTGGNRGGGQTGQTNGFEIVRGGIRTRLVPKFQFNRAKLSGEAISTSFGSRLNRLPVAHSFAGNVNLAVEGRKGTLTGNVSSAEERAQVERLARMEPGIYQIDNQIIVSQQ